MKFEIALMEFKMVYLVFGNVFWNLGIIIWEPVVLADHPQHPHKLVATQPHLDHIFTLL